MQQHDICRLSDHWETDYVNVFVFQVAMVSYCRRRDFDSVSEHCSKVKMWAVKYQVCRSSSTQLPSLPFRPSNASGSPQRCCRRLHCRLPSLSKHWARSFIECKPQGPSYHRRRGSTGLELCFSHSKYIPGNHSWRFHGSTGRKI